MQNEMRQRMQQILPNTHNALTWLVPSMEAAYRCAGKKTIFGKDKFAPAYQKVIANIEKTISSMMIDGIINHSTSSDDIKEELIKAMTFFANAYPNWPDGYAFFKISIIDSKNNDLTKIISSISQTAYDASLEKWKNIFEK